MAGQSPGFNQQFSHDGAPAAGFLLYSFATGTNTPKTTYQDSAEGAAHTNPIELDDQGRVPGLGLFLLTNGNYDFELRDLDDALVKAWENYSAVPLAADDTFLPLEGGVSMTGTFELSGPAEDPLNPTPLSQVEDLIAAAVAAAVADLATQVAPVGTIYEWMVETVPAKHLWLNGQAVSRTTYSALFTLWGVTFGAGDGTTTFTLPNRLGRFVRGYDPDGTTDPDGGSRDLTTQQDSATGPHTHVQNSGRLQADGNVPAGGGAIMGYGTDSNADVATDANSGTGSATETRPINVPTIWIVKALP